MSELKPVNDLRIALSQRQVEAFDTFQDRLYAKNLVMNLTRVPQEECWERHFADSLTLSSLIPQAATVLDVGSGPGFPGICLAIARKDISVTLLDSSGKALDIMNSDVTLGNQIAAFLQAHASELNIFDVIWRQHIWTTQRAGDGWRSMPNRGSATANHMDHVHVSVY